MVTKGMVSKGGVPPMANPRPQKVAETSPCVVEVYLHHPGNHL